jgi:hypothetical protein
LEDHFNTFLQSACLTDTDFFTDKKQNILFWGYLKCRIIRFSELSDKELNNFFLIYEQPWHLCTPNKSNT